MISIIDDDESVREATSGLLRSLGYLTATFASAEDFLGSNQIGTTSCLITDIQMPGMSGLDLQLRLVTHGYTKPVIFITAFPDEKIRAKTLAAGAIGYLPKPFDEDTLVACVDEALGVSHPE